MVAGLFSKSKQFKIQRQLTALLLLSTSIPAVLVSLYGIVSVSRVASRAALDAVDVESTDRSQYIEAFLSGDREDVVYLSKSPMLQSYLDASGGGDVLGLSASAWQQRLTDNMVTLLEAKSHYQKVRYIDESGREVIRLEKDSQNPEQVTIFPESELQDKSDRPYFEGGIVLEPGEIHVTDISLQQDQGRILEPYQEQIHYSAPVFDSDGTRRGIMVATIFANQFIDAVAEQKEHENSYTVMVNDEGTYVAHPDDSKEWSNDLGHGENFRNDFSEQAVEAVLTGVSGIAESRESLLAYTQVDPNPGQTGEEFYVIEVLSKGEVYGPANSFKLVAALVTLLSLAIVIPVGIVRGRQLIKVLERLAAGISTSTQEMATTIAEQERIASQQAASVNETTTTMDELEASSRHASEQAAASVEAAKQAFDSSEEGALAVGKSLEGMFALENKVEAIAEKIVALSGQADQIGSISQLVIDFANQTNMLALNSSVEAVRAGEHGKGFAVVANEIRKLADQSQQSADKINGLVSDIQKSINETVMVAEEGTKTVKSGVQTAKQTEATFDKIKEAVNQVVLNNQQVSLNLKQQVNAIEQVVEAMDVIDRGAKETASGLTQTKAGTDQLRDAAVDLQQMV